MITVRELRRDELEQVWQIDRREVIENVYYLEDGVLVLRPEYYDMQGWPSGETDASTRLFYDCFDRGGWFCGLFDADKIIGVVILEGSFIGKNGDQLQLKFLHISRDYRRNGLGRRLFELARAKARQSGARRMYISATPSENRVKFYLGVGAAVTDEPDPDLLELEPADIHMECLT
ncbi:MAG: GNAT family N-acetyltransferase [Dehalococcoidia bacterium]